MPNELTLMRAEQHKSDPTETEAMLWKHLLDQPDLAPFFGREVVVCGFIADFYAGRWALVVEVDGASHRGREKEDKRRDRELALFGALTVRFTADDIEERIEWVLSTIRQVIGGIEQRRARGTFKPRRRAVADMSDTQREIRAAQREARALWSSLRRDAKLDRFTDTAALRALGNSLERVWGEVEWHDIEAAIREHAVMKFARHPWMLDEWARQARTVREEKERIDLPMSVKLAALKAARR